MSPIDKSKHAATTNVGKDEGDTECAGETGKK
jgi:hypothetical protein